MNTIFMFVSTVLLETLLILHSLSASSTPHIREKRSAENVTTSKIESEADAFIYLDKYGFNSCEHQIMGNNDANGKVLCMSSAEAMLKDFQNRYGLQITGKFDEETLKLMSGPRCGIKDKPLTFKMRQPWPKKSLTWKLADGNIPRFKTYTAREQLHQSFDDWAKHTPLTFTEVLGTEKADFNLFFTAKGDPGSEGFDGPGGTLAYAYMPTVGILRFEAVEKWTDEYNGDGVNFRLVATHEIGHALGLDHSYEKSAIMFAMYQLMQPNNLLPTDDRNGIQALYGKGSPSGRKTPNSPGRTPEPPGRTPKPPRRTPPRGSKTKKALFRFGSPHGRPGSGVSFNDAIDLHLSPLTPCVGVELFYYPEHLFAIRFIYGEENVAGSKHYHGDPAPRNPPLLNEKFMMNNGERINKVTSYVGTHLWQYKGSLITFVLGIQFSTTSGRTSQLYGSKGGKKYTEFYEGFTFAYAKGGSVTLLDHLQIVWTNQEIVKIDEGEQFAARCAASPASSMLKILSAVYQIKTRPWHDSADVTHLVRKTCGIGKYCYFMVASETLSENVCPTCPKELHVTYTCSDNRNIFGPILSNSDSFGNDITINGQVYIAGVKSIEMCGNHCLREVRCVGVVYNPELHYCYLKHAMVGRLTRENTHSMVVVNRARYL